MQVFGCFFSELNHSDVGAGSITLTELWLEADCLVMKACKSKELSVEEASGVPASSVLGPSSSKSAVFWSS